MDSDTKQSLVRELAARSGQSAKHAHVVWSAHAVGELVADRLTRSEVEAALAGALLIEDYPTRTRPLPDCLVLGRLPRGEPIHAVVAIDTEQDRILIVTVYRPGIEEWEDDWCTRKT